LKKWIEQIRKCNYLKESDVIQLCKKVKEILMEESNVIPIFSPVTVCGDIHGQFYDLLCLFKMTGECPDNNFLFLGDIVDRGYHSVECILLILCLKASYPEKITLLRGNHESRQTTHIYGFYDEIVQKYGNVNPWNVLMDLFDYLPISATIDGKIFCVHGGLSPEISTIDEIRLINRVCEVPDHGGYADLLWSDPADPNVNEESNITTYEPSTRGAGYLFGEIPVIEFIALNYIQLICRSHQLCDDGYRYYYNEQLLTIWSAPNYCYRCENKAAVLTIDEDESRILLQFEEAPPEERVTPPQKPLPYYNYF